MGIIIPDCAIRNCVIGNVLYTGVTGKIIWDGNKKTGEQGFEPRLTDPESVVLPLHYSPVLVYCLSYTAWFCTFSVGHIPVVPARASQVGLSFL